MVEAFADAAALLLGGRVATAFLFALSRHTNLAAVLRRTDAGSTVLVLLAFRPGPTGTTSLDPHHGIITDLTPLAGSMGRRPVGFPGLRADPFEAALPAKLPLCAVIVPLTHGVDRIRQARGYGAFTGAGPLSARFKAIPRRHRRRRSEQFVLRSKPLSNHVPRSCTKPFPNNPHSDNINVNSMFML